MTKTIKAHNKDRLSVKQRLKRHNRAMNGDAVALMECSYASGVCTREQLEDFYTISRDCEEEEQEQV